MRKFFIIMGVSAVVAGGAVWALLSLPGQKPDPELLTKLAPADAYFYLSIPNDPVRAEEYQRSNLHRLVEHPEVRKFVDPIKDAIRDLLKKDDVVTKETGLTLDEIWGLLGGPLAVAVYDVPVQSQPMPNVALTITAEDALKISEALEKVRKKVGSQPEWTAKESKVHGHTVVSLGPDSMGLHYTVLGPTVILSPSRPHLEALLARLEKGEAGSLAADARFQNLRKKLARADRALATAYVGLAPLWGRFKGQIPPDADKVIESLAIRDISALGFSLEYDVPQIRERYVALTDRQDRGLVKLIAGTPREDATIRYVPKDASTYSYWNLSLGELYDAISGFVKSSRDAAEGFDSAMKEFEKRFKFNLRKDFLGKLGSSWTVYARTPAPKATTSEMVAIVGLEDSKGLFGALEKLFAAGEIPIRREEVQGQPMISIALSPKAGEPTPLPPPLAKNFEGQTVVFFAKEARLFIGLTGDEPAKFAARVSTTGATVRENPRFSEILAKVPKQVDFLMLQDEGDAVAPALELLKQMPPDALPPQLQDPKTGNSFLTPETLPKAETLKELIGVAATFKRTERDAIVVESVSDVGGFSVPAIAGGGVVAALLLPAVTKATERAKITSCANNLSQLWKLQWVYASQFGGPQKKMPSEVGSAFWLALTKTKPPLIDETESDIFMCPLSKMPPRPGATSYRGPRVDVSKLADSDPVGCCEPGCHPNGTINVILKSGDVVETSPGEELYERAIKGTKK